MSRVLAGVVCGLVGFGVVALPTGTSVGGIEARQVPGAIRTGITMVPVDVRVLDARGNPIIDLTRDDFEVYEDDARQEIAHFAHTILSAEEPEPGARPIMRRPQAPDAAPLNQRIFLFVLGRGRLQPPAKGVDGVLEFVRTRLLPQDQVAVLAYNRATDFTTDHARIGHVLERFKRIHESLEAKLDHRVGGLAAVYGPRDIPVSLQDEIDSIFRGPGAPGFRRLPPGRITDSGQIQEDTRRELDAINAVNIEPFNDYVSTHVETIHDLSNVYAGIEYLRFLEGEKHLVLVSERGLYLPRVENDDSIAALANDARVAIDTIQTGGLHNDAPGRRTLSEEAWRRTFSAMALKNVSALTGGQSSLFRYASAALERIDRATRSRYLLGYYPRDGRWDGRYRRIHVKVKRPGATALFRQGYYARPQLLPFDRRQFLTFTRMAAAGHYREEIRDIKLTVKAALDGSGVDREVVVRTHIDPTRLGFADAEGRKSTALELAVFWGDARERLVAEYRQAIDLTLDGETHQRVMREGIAHTARLQLPLEPRYVKVVVYDYAADILGSAVVRLR